MIYKGKDFKNKVQKGVNEIADLVEVTMGPMGKTVFIRDPFGRLTATKDGISVARRVSLEDDAENTAAMFVKDASMRTNEKAGDGTTSTITLTRELYNLARREEELGFKPKFLIKGIKDAEKQFLDNLKKEKRNIEVTAKDIERVSMMSSNGDKEITAALIEIYKKLGRYAAIIPLEGSSNTIEINTIPGMYLESGFLAAYSINDFTRMKATYDNPLFYLVDGKIKKVENIIKPLKVAKDLQRPLVVIAEDVSGEALQVLGMNHENGIVSSLIVKSPGYGERRKELLHDISAITNARVFQEKTNFNAITFKNSDLGEAKSIESTQNDTAIIASKPNETYLKQRVKEVKDKLAAKNLNSYEVEKLEERLAKLTSGIAVVKVGGKGEAEAKEKLDRFIDAKSAVKAALEEGVIKGGGMAYIELSYNIVPDLKATEGEKRGVTIFKKAMYKPFNVIANNAEFNPELLLHKLKEDGVDGFNFENSQFISDMYKEGIIDPAKVIRIAVESAVSVSTILLTGEAGIFIEEAFKGK